ncbi:hypothetical protein NE237_015969 [Protea cynaroides]|uniref:Uncharacterized protein n=1 Tax=Protea cynaroides TaxID=273540 RepID=A0A9Q0QRL2_9MAGN|nr:hypothetical protein NE237_015969 [Protea cynaroides]
MPIQMNNSNIYFLILINNETIKLNGSALQNQQSFCYKEIEKFHEITSIYFLICINNETIKIKWIHSSKLTKLLLQREREAILPRSTVATMRDSPFAIEFEERRVLGKSGKESTPISLWFNFYFYFTLIS